MSAKNPNNQLSSNCRLKGLTNSFNIEHGCYLLCTLLFLSTVLGVCKANISIIRNRILSYTVFVYLCTGPPSQGPLLI